MQKPNNYDETQVQGEFIPVELGGHKMIVKQVSEKKSKKGKNMVVVLFDFAEGDNQAGYFTKQFKDDIRPDKKWPNQATQYILTEDQEGKCSKSFKTFITCIEHSNPGFITKWGIENWGAQFKNKAIGGVFGPQMDYYDGKEKEKRVLRWFISIDGVADATVPAMSETQAYKDYKAGQKTMGAPDSDGFMSIPEELEDEFPFN